MVSQDAVLGLIRHILTFGGGFAVAKGWTDEVTIMAIAGAIVTAAGGIWSIAEKAMRE